MLKELLGRETLQHHCDSSKRKWSLEIYIHDVQAYAFDPVTNKMHYIKYCPYCAVDIESEERP